MKRVKWLHLRLSPVEHALILKKRESSTCRNLSQYIRNIILDRPVITTYRNLSQDEVLEQLAVLNREMNAIGNNLNQVTKKLHTLDSAEKTNWASEFSSEIEAIFLKLSEIKEFFLLITERWLR